MRRRLKLLLELLECLATAPTQQEIEDARSLLLAMATRGSFCLRGGGRLLIEILLPYKHSEVLMDDLDERFPRKVEQYGLTRARLWYCSQAFLSFRPLVWGMVVAAWETIRRIAN